LKEKQKSPLRLFFLFFFLVIARAKKKKDGNYEITTTTNSMQTGKKIRKFSSLKKPSPKALRLMPVA
jgi:hypothetical protein